MTSAAAFSFIHLLVALGLFAALVFYIYWHFVWLKSFTQRLQASHPRQWELLGKPSVPMTNTGFRFVRMSFLKFLMTGAYRRLNDRGLTGVGDRLRFANWGALIISSIVLLVQSVSHW